MSFKVIYEGVDIYPDVSVGRCWCDERAWGGLDALTVDFGDTRRRWDSWRPAPGDSIAVEDGAARVVTDRGGLYISADEVTVLSRYSGGAAPALR